MKLLLAQWVYLISPVAAVFCLLALLRRSSRKHRIVGRVLLFCIPVQVAIWCWSMAYLLRLSYYFEERIQYLPYGQPKREVLRFVGYRPTRISLTRDEDGTLSSDCVIWWYEIGVPLIRFRKGLDFMGGKLVGSREGYGKPSVVFSEATLPFWHFVFNDYVPIVAACLGLAALLVLVPRPRHWSLIVLALALLLFIASLIFTQLASAITGRFYEEEDVDLGRTLSMALSGEFPPGSWLYYRLSTWLKMLGSWLGVLGGLSFIVHKLRRRNKTGPNAE